ncbi:MAG: ribonuclease HI [Verrucomicrobia bacterium]|nr:MAG: ribonuclease HI [Verrucomicrobiota bacterium]
MKEITIYTDGGCEGNPGPGGWAAVLAYGPHLKEISGGEPATTNNRMELRAAVEALGILQEACVIIFHTDSEYLKDGITQWVAGWKRSGWRTKNKKPVKNQDLWMSLDAASQKHQIRWEWVKAHAGQPQNERCDVLAGRAIEKIRQQYTPAQLKASLAEFKTTASDPKPSKTDPSLF